MPPILPWFNASKNCGPYFWTLFLLTTYSPPIKRVGTSSLLPEPPVTLPPVAFLENKPRRPETIPPPPPPLPPPVTPLVMMFARLSSAASRSLLAKDNATSNSAFFKSPVLFAAAFIASEIASLKPSVAVSPNVAPN